MFESLYSDQHKGRSAEDRPFLLPMRRSSRSGAGLRERGPDAGDGDRGEGHLEDVPDRKGCTALAKAEPMRLDWSSQAAVDAEREQPEEAEDEAARHRRSAWRAQASSTLARSAAIGGAADDVGHRQRSRGGSRRSGRRGRRCRRRWRRPAGRRRLRGGRATTVATPMRQPKAAARTATAKLCRVTGTGQVGTLILAASGDDQGAEQDGGEIGRAGARYRPWAARTPRSVLGVVIVTAIAIPFGATDIASVSSLSSPRECNGRPLPPPRPSTRFRPPDRQAGRGRARRCAGHRAQCRALHVHRAPTASCSGTTAWRWSIPGRTTRAHLAALLRGHRRAARSRRSSSPTRTATIRRWRRRLASAETGAPLWFGGPHRLSRPPRPFEMNALSRRAATGAWCRTGRCSTARVSMAGDVTIDGDRDAGPLRQPHGVRRSRHATGC